MIGGGVLTSKPIFVHLNYLIFITTDTALLVKMGVYCPLLRFFPGLSNVLVFFLYAKYIMLHVDYTTIVLRCINCELAICIINCLYSYMYITLTICESLDCVCLLSFIIYCNKRPILLLKGCYCL